MSEGAFSHVAAHLYLNTKEMEKKMYICETLPPPPPPSICLSLQNAKLEKRHNYHKIYPVVFKS